MDTSTDRIEREVHIKAPRSRVWAALSNAEEFGDWFGVNLTGKSFAEGQAVAGQITHPGYEHIMWEVIIDRMIPDELFSFRWHPYAVSTDVDYSSELKTLVEFRLADADGGTLLTLVESGFDNVPEARRLEAFRMNSGGWDEQMNNINKHVTGE